MIKYNNYKEFEDDNKYINKKTLSRKDLEEINDIYDILDYYPNNLKLYTIHEVMKNEGIEFVTGSNAIVKCENGILKIEHDDNEWVFVYLTKSYLEAVYIKLED